MGTELEMDKKTIEQLTADIKKTTQGVERLSDNINSLDKAVQEIKALLTGDNGFYQGVGIAEMTTTMWSDYQKHVLNRDCLSGMIKDYERYGQDWVNMAKVWGGISIILSILGISSMASLIMFIEFIKERL